MKNLITILSIFLLISFSFNAQAAAKKKSTLSLRVEASTIVYNAQKIINPIFAASGAAYLSNAKVREILGTKYESVAKAMAYLINAFNRSEVNGNKEQGLNINKLRWGKRFAGFSTICFVSETKTNAGTEIIFTWRSFEQRQEMEANGHQWRKY